MLLTKYREICPTATVVRQGKELARARVRTTTKCGHISRYLVNNPFIAYPSFSIIKLGEFITCSSILYISCCNIT